MILSPQQNKATEEQMVRKMISNDPDGIGSASPSTDRSREALNDKNLSQTLDENEDDDWNV